MRNDNWEKVGKVIIILVVIFGFTFMLVAGSDSLTYNDFSANCSSVMKVSKYPAKMEIDFWDYHNNHCWLEVAPGIWADSNYIQYDKAQ